MNLIGFFGRLCLVIIFIISAIYKFSDLATAESYLANGMCNLLGYTQGMDWLQGYIDYFLPMSYNLVLAAAIVEALCSLLILFGIQARLGAGVLALYLIPLTFIFHHFWYLDGDEKMMQMVMFLKNLAIFGGLLLVLAYGTGPTFIQSKPSHDKNKQT
jgi:putative oxidoreductase